MSRRAPLVPIGAAFGMFFGAVLGLVLNGFATPVGGGLAIGAGVGGVVELWRRRRERDAKATL
jgi:hypothetical protein